MERKPLVSIILCVRDGMPHVKEAIESVRTLTYPNYELIVQDGASTDGTREHLESTDGLPSMSIVSEPDSGIGQGFNRAIRRCSGEIVGSVDADNLLRSDALDIVVRRFAENPHAAVIYGACNMIDSQGTFINSWIPPEFELLGLLDGKVVPPFATSFFSRFECGEDLRFDEDFPTVADFELWLRLGDRRVVRTFDVLADVRVGQQSSTWNVANYDEQCRYKLLALERSFKGAVRDRILAKLHERAQAGIYLWAVDSMTNIDGGQENIDRYFEKATRADLRSERFREILERAHPKLPASEPELGRRLFECGVEYLKKLRFDTALLYFEFLRSSGYEVSGLDELIARTKAEKREAQLKTEIAELLQGEVNRRDQLLAEQQAWWASEVTARDVDLDRLRRQQEWMRRGWRRWIVGRPPAY